MHRALWQTKPALREVYAHLHRRILQCCVSGITVEVGGGSGNLKDRSPEIVSFDVVFAPWLDLVSDAQALPFATESIGNIVMLDVFHHIENPLRFLREAERVLVRGGRVVMVEPAITPVSWAFYRFLHDEPVIMTGDPLAEGEPTPFKDPYLGNQGIPTLLVTRHAERLSALVPGLRLLRHDWLSLAAYPLSGGFKPWSLLKPGMAHRLLAIEDAVSPWIGRLFGFRLLIVIEKYGAGGERRFSARKGSL